MMKWTDVTNLETISSIDVPKLNMSPKNRTEYKRRLKEVSYMRAKSPREVFRPKNFWKDTKVGRFMSLRTRASKVAVGAIATGASTLLPPPIGNVVGTAINQIIPTQTGATMIEFLQGDMIEIIMGILIVGLGVAASFMRSKAKQLLLRLQAMVKELRVGKQMYDEFKQKESDGGKELTAQEYKQLAEQLGTIISVLSESNREVISDE